MEVVRHDKTWNDAMTYEELLRAKNQSSGKLVKRSLDGVAVAGLTQQLADEVGGGGGSRKKRRLVPKQPAAALPVAQSAADTSDVIAVTSSLQGKVIVIEPSQNKAELERVVARHGGSVEQNAIQDHTDIYVVTVGKLRAKAVINQLLCDVVKADWLRDCAVKFRPLQPSDMLVTTEATASDFERRRFDKFGDCHIEDATESSLKFSMSQVTDPTPSDVDVAYLRDHFSREYNLGIFCGIVAHVDTRCRDHKLISLLVKFYGGQSRDDMESSDTLTHVLTSREDSVRLTELKAARRRCKHGNLFRILDADFVHRCVEEKRLLDQTDFEL